MAFLERYHEITVRNSKSCFAKKSNSNHWFVTFEYESRIDLQPDEKVKIICNSLMVPCKILSARRPSEMNKHRNLGLFHTGRNENCNIRPEDTYRRKIKLGSKTTDQRLNRALHAFHSLYQASTFGGLSNIGSTKRYCFRLRSKHSN